MKVFAVHLRGGRDVIVVGESYHHEDKHYVFGPPARILKYRPRRYRRRGEDDGLRLPGSSETVSFYDAEVMSVVEVVPEPPLLSSLSFAPPNGGPAARSSNSGVSGGLPSVSWPLDDLDHHAR